MTTVFVITTNEALESSLDRYFRYVHGSETHSCRFLFSSQPSDKLVWAQNSFHRLSTWIERTIRKEEELHDSIAFLDFNSFNHRQDESRNSPQSPSERPLADPYDLDLLDAGEPHWKAVAGMLIMAFPEVHWIFPGVAPSDVSGLFEKAHIFRSTSSLQELVQFHQQGFVSLFDPTGLRNALRSNIAQEGGEEKSIPNRDHIIAAIDDEKSYAYFNAHTAYRFGYRAWTVVSWATMKRLFEGGETSECPAASIELLLEDLYCSFSDRPSDSSLSLSLLKSKEDEDQEEGRDDRLPALRSAEGLERRVIVTVGHEREKQRRNRQYLRNEWVPAGDNRIARMVQKPLGGSFDLWRKVGMWEWRLWSRNGRPRTAKGYQWPPKEKQNVEQGNGGHSAPGRLLAIAERLIERSRAVLQEAGSVPDATYAATLALEAKELLSNRTPTTALEAVTLQHRAEVVAESMFHGVEFHLDVESRFQEIKKEVEAIGQWFSGRRRKRVTLNARLAIVEDLAREFSELDQFEEERKCRAEARRLYFDFWAHQSSWRLPFLPLLRYLSFSLRSLPVFLGLVVFWVLLFGVSWELLEPTVNVGAAVPDMRYRSFWDALTSSTVYFFTLTPPGSYWGEAERQVLWNLVLIFQSVVSLSHLGLLVSHIYLIVSRR